MMTGVQWVRPAALTPLDSVELFVGSNTANAVGFRRDLELGAAKVLAAHAPPVARRELEPPTNQHPG